MILLILVYVCLVYKTVVRLTILCAIIFASGIAFIPPIIAEFTQHNDVLLLLLLFLCIWIVLVICIMCITIERELQGLLSIITVNLPKNNNLLLIIANSLVLLLPLLFEKNI